MTLTAKQRLFLDNHVYRKKRTKQPKLAEAYSQQRQEVLVLLDGVPMIDSELKKLQVDLTKIDSEAADQDGCDFAAASKKLAALRKQIEATAQALDLSREVAKVAKRVADVEQSGLAALAARQKLTADVAALKRQTAIIAPALLPPPPRGTPAWDNVARPLLRRFRLQVKRVENAAHSFATTLADWSKFAGEPAVTAPARQQSIVEELLKAARAAQDRDAQLTLFALLDRLRYPALAKLRVPGDDATFLSVAEVRLEVELARRDVAAALQPLKDQLDALQADTGFADQYEEGDGQPASVRSKLNDEKRGDQRVLNPANQPALAPVIKPPAPTFDVAGMLQAMPPPAGSSLTTGSARLDYQPDANALETAQKDARHALADFLNRTGITVNSEEFFDLALQSPEELANSYMASMGWKLADERTKGRKAVAKAVADALFKLVQSLRARRQDGQGQPAGAQMDLAQGQLKLAGKRFGNGKELARGAFGTATRYENLDKPGEFVVVKSSVANPDDPIASRTGHAAMKDEIKAHRRLMNTPEGQDGRQYVATMQDAVAAEDGSLHMVLEMIEGGDLNTNRMTDMLAADSGALPEAARAVLNQARVREAALALKFMRDEGMVHFDVKDANFMMTAEGTVKLIDFGSAKTVEAGGRTAVPGAVTEGFAPARAAASADSSFDTFALGKVLQLMHLNPSAPDGAENQDEVPPEFKGLTGALGRLSEAMTSADEAKRPTLEAVLNSSYIQNLEQFDPAAIQALSAKTIEYGKVLKAEADTVRSSLPPSDLDDWANKAGKSADSLSLDDIVLAIKKDIEAFQADIATARAEQKALQAMPPPIANPRGLPQIGRDRGIIAQRRDVTRKLTDLADRVQKRQDQLALFGQSPAAKILAQEMRYLSDQLLRPSAPDAGKQEGAGDGTVDKMMDAARISQLRRALPPRIKALGQRVKEASLQRHPNVKGAGARVKEAFALMATDADKAASLLDEAEALLA